VLLTLAFRSLLVPAIGAIGNLLTIAVALGSTGRAPSRDDARQS
jgi:RND superfamily putative drug exporter